MTVKKVSGSHFLKGDASLSSKKIFNKKIWEKVSGKTFFKKFSPLIFFLVLLACAQHMAIASGGTEAFEKKISQLKEARGEQAREIRTALEELVNKYPDNDLADNALLEIGRSLLVEEQYQDAVVRFERILTQYPNGDARYEARYLLGTTLYKLGRLEESASALSKVSPKEPFYVESSFLYIKILLALGKTNDAVVRYTKIRKLLKSPSQISELDSALRKAVLELNDEALENICKSASDSPLAVVAMFTLAQRTYKQGDFRRAQDLLTKILAQYPDDELSQQARALLAEIEKIRGINKNAIGIILPMTGKWANYGRKYLYGASLALSAFSPSPESKFPFELYVMDSQGNPEKAREAVEELCSQKRVIAIIGPVQSDEAMSAGKEAQSCGVPMITLTQVEEVTQIGDMIFRNFVTPRDQARTLVWFATTSKGLKTFAIFYPDHTYGKLFKSVFIQEAGKAGGEVVLAQPYQPGQTDFKQEIRLLASQKRRIEALFVPDTYRTASLIGPQLKFYNVVRIQLLGSSGWNSQKLIEYVQPQTSSIEGAVFTDGFFAQSPQPLVRDFVFDFGSTFGYEPEIYEATAYETAKVLAMLISEKRVSTRWEMRNALASLSNFPTFSGDLSVQADRSFRKPLFILQVRNGQIIDISASTNF